MVTGRPAQRRRARHLSTGQAMVEFALITPVFFLVFFSIVEFALITASIGSYDFAARDGARIGAVIGPTDACIDTDTGTCSGTNTGITGIVPTIQHHVQGLVMAKMTEVEIFDADPSSGLCVPSGGGAPVQVDAWNCLEEEYPIASNGTIGTPTLDTWHATSRNDSVAKDDYIGVRVWYDYTYVTGFVAGLGTNLSLSATSVQEIEPQVTDVKHHSPLTAFATAPSGARVMTAIARRPAGSSGSPACVALVPAVGWLRKGPGGCA